MQSTKSEYGSPYLATHQHCFFLQAQFWVQVMRDLRHGVKLKKVQERQYNLLPIEFQFTPYEMLMDDIRTKRYKLRKVLVSVHMHKWILGHHVSIYNQNLFLNFSLNKQAWVICPFVPTVKSHIAIHLYCRDHKPQQYLLCLSGIKQAYFWSCRVGKYFIGLNWIKWMTLKTVNQEGLRLQFRNRHLRWQNFHRDATSESTPHMIGQFELSEVIGQFLFTYHTFTSSY